MAAEGLKPLLAIVQMIYVEDKKGWKQPLCSTKLFPPAVEESLTPPKAFVSH